jgi:hypothetical protein
MGRGGGGYCTGPLRDLTARARLGTCLAGHDKEHPPRAERAAERAAGRARAAGPHALPQLARARCERVIRLGVDGPARLGTTRRVRLRIRVRVRLRIRRRARFSAFEHVE